MPFYEYECQNCKYYTEVMQKISDPPLRKCPSCSKLKLKKLVSAPVFRLKGGGWYETDFKSDKESKRNLAGGERDESSSSDSKPADSKAADSKPAESKPAESKPAPAAESGGASGKRSSSAAKTKASPVRAKPKPVSKAKAKSSARKARR